MFLVTCSVSWEYCCLTALHFSFYVSLSLLSCLLFLYLATTMFHSSQSYKDLPIMKLTHEVDVYWKVIYSFILLTLTLFIRPPDVTKMTFQKVFKYKLKIFQRKSPHSIPFVKWKPPNKVHFNILNNISLGFFITIVVEVTSEQLESYYFKDFFKINAQTIHQDFFNFKVE